jgi:ATP-dependent DNA helicase RecG
MSIPPWADEQLSQDLAELRARGEGQEMEFKQSCPQQVTDVAREIAAFATSNTGKILFGVEDNGNLCGLEGMEDAAARDSLLRRLEGICNGSVKPAVTPRATWAIESDRVVLAVTVPKGSEPVYYSQGRPYLRHQGRPYLRHITTSRPAEPHEVVDLVRRYLGSQLESQGVEDSEESAFYSELGSTLNRLLLWAETPVRERQVNPWLEEWRADYGYAALELRQLAARDIAVRMGLAERIRELATALDQVPAFRMHLGGGSELETIASHASKLASALKQDTVDKIPLSEASVAQARTLIREISGRLSDLGDRAQQIVDTGRIEDLQSGLGSMGRQLVERSFYDLSSLGTNVSDRLREIGMRMRLLEVARIYLDGGVSMQRIVDQVSQCKDELATLTESLQ